MFQQQNRSGEETESDEVVSGEETESDEVDESRHMDIEHEDARENVSKDTSEPRSQSSQIYGRKNPDSVYYRPWNQINLQDQSRKNQVGTQPELRVHERTYSGKKPYRCDFTGCDKAFSRNWNLTEHKRIHSGEKLYKCDFDGCVKAFVQKCNLTRHKRIHSGEKPFNCDFDGCDKAFAQKGNLKLHKLTHSGEKPHRCDFNGCGKAFAQIGSLKRHKRIHSGEKQGVSLVQMPLSSKSLPQVSPLESLPISQNGSLSENKLYYLDSRDLLTDGSAFIYAKEPPEHSELVDATLYKNGADTYQKYQPMGTYYPDSLHSLEEIQQEELFAYYKDKKHQILASGTKVVIVKQGQVVESGGKAHRIIKEEFFGLSYEDNYKTAQLAQQWGKVNHQASPKKGEAYCYVSPGAYNNALFVAGRDGKDTLGIVIPLPIKPLLDPESRLKRTTQPHFTLNRISDPQRSFHARQELEAWNVQISNRQYLISRKDKGDITEFDCQEKIDFLDQNQPITIVIKKRELPIARKDPNVIDLDPDSDSKRGPDRSKRRKGNQSKLTKEQEGANKIDTILKNLDTNTEEQKAEAKKPGKLYHLKVLATILYEQLERLMRLQSAESQNKERQEQLKRIKVNSLKIQTELKEHMDALLRINKAFNQGEEFNVKALGTASKGDCGFLALKSVLSFPFSREKFIQDFMAYHTVNQKHFSPKMKTEFKNILDQTGSKDINDWKVKFAKHIGDHYDHWMGEEHLFFIAHMYPIKIERYALSQEDPRSDGVRFEHIDTFGDPLNHPVRIAMVGTRAGIANHFIGLEVSKEDTKAADGVPMDLLPCPVSGSGTSTTGGTPSLLNLTGDPKAVSQGTVSDLSLVNSPVFNPGSLPVHPMTLDPTIYPTLFSPTTNQYDGQEFTRYSFSEGMEISGLSADPTSSDPLFPEFLESFNWGEDASNLEDVAVEDGDLNDE